jgi:hypothetical protein
VRAERNAGSRITKKSYARIFRILFAQVAAFIVIQRLRDKGGHGTGQDR